ncbi:MAG: hypothetical protein ACLGPL_00955 [Acidobacteriota bacterium]
MPRGASAKREREYNELKEEFKDEGRYKGREEEVAARIVNKQRAEYGETKDAKQEDKKGKSPDRNLPIDDYDHMTVDKVVAKLDSLSAKEIEKIKAYERRNKDRKTLVEAIDRKLQK